MFGLKRKRRSSSFLKVFSNLRKPGEKLEGYTIDHIMVYPSNDGRTGRARIVIYTDKGNLELNTLDCDIEIKLEENE